MVGTGGYNKGNHRSL